MVRMPGRVIKPKDLVISVQRSGHAVATRILGAEDSHAFRPEVGKEPGCSGDVPHPDQASDGRGGRMGS